MKTDILKKKFDKTHNLLDYEKTYQTFSWKTFEKDLFWFANHKINAAYNAIDRNAKNFRKNKIALYYEGELGEKEKFTFLELSELSNKFANVLSTLEIKKGERVFIFLPRIPELYISFLGILKTGAIAGTLFSAFQEQALIDRLGNSKARIVITDSELFPRIEKIKSALPGLEKVLVVDRKGLGVKTRHSYVLDFTKEILQQSPKYRIAQMDKDDPAFMLYTSGTTGKPKGVVHRHFAVLQEYLTSRWVLDLRDDDVYWCTADPGWVTGIAYEILGSWSNGASTVVYAGRFDPSRWYKIIEDYKVTVWYTAPTAIRMLAAEGENLVKKFNLTSLRHLASVGEPLNPQALLWGLAAFGLPFHDNWWQTETGAICIANYPNLPIKPGSMGKPFPGITAAVIDEQGKELPPRTEGNLALKPGFPSLMIKIWGRPKKYQSYFVNGWYISGDRAYKDKDGYFWFVGRADDVIKTAGERVGPFEVESALVSHPAVVEAGVIGKPDPLRGEIIKAFVVLKADIKSTDKLKEELSIFVKKHLAGHAFPREIEFIDKLPKTRSGKIMRRVLKAKELGLPIGDTSTLEEY